MEFFVTNLQSIFVDSTYQIAGIILLTALFHVLVKLLLTGVSKSTQYTNNKYDDVIIEAITKPLLSLTWLLGITLTIEVFEGNEEIPLLDIANIALQVGAIILLSWAVIRIITAVENEAIKNLKGKNRLAEDGTISAFAKLLRIVIMISTALILLQNVGISISGLLAFGGIGGLAIGFAAQDLLSNFFGGLMIHLDRPFAVGDWVRSPDQNIEGTVEHIGWRVTTIRTFDKRPLYVPNSTFSNISVENPGRMRNRRIKETIGLRYDDAKQVRVILTEIREYLLNHNEIDTTQTLMVNFNEFNDSSMDFFIYCFTKTTVWTKFHSIKEEVLLDILDIIIKHGADVAYPTQRLNVEVVGN